MSGVVLIFFVSFLASRQDNEKPLRLEQYQLCYALPGVFSFYLDIKRNKTSSQSNSPPALIHFYTSTKSKAFSKGKSKLLLRSLTKWSIHPHTSHALW